MPIDARCGDCGLSFAADAAQAGRTVPCPKCAKPIPVPAASKPADNAGPRYKVVKPPNPYRRPNGADKPPPIQVPLQVDELEVIEEPAPAAAVTAEAPELLPVPEPQAILTALAPARHEPVPTPASSCLSEVPEGERPQEYDLKPPVRTAPILIGRAKPSWDRAVAAALALVGLGLMALLSYAIYQYAPRLRSLGWDPAARPPTPPQASGDRPAQRDRPAVVQQRPQPQPQPPYVNPNPQPNDPRTTTMVQVPPGQPPLPPWQRPNPNPTWVPPPPPPNVNPNPTQHLAPNPNAGTTPRVQPAPVQPAPIEFGPPPPPIPNLRLGSFPVLPATMQDAEVGPFEAIVYPAVPAPVMAVFRPSPGRKEVLVERWAVAPAFKKTGEASFEPDDVEVQAKLNASYPGLVHRHSISRDGAYLVRVAQSRVQVWSFEDKRFVHQIGIGAPSGVEVSLQVLGFVDDEHFALLWFRGAAASVDVISARTGQSRKEIQLPHLRRSTGRTHDARIVAVSPDGKRLAAFSDAPPAIRLFDLLEGRRVLDLPVPDRPHLAYPFHLAWSQDGSAVALVYDRTHASTVLVGPADGSARLTEVRFEQLDLAYTGGHVHAGKAVDFLPDHRTLFLYGQVAFDPLANPAGILGQVAETPWVRQRKQVIGQRRIAPDTFLVEIATMRQGKYERALTVLKLDLAKMGL